MKRTSFAAVAAVLILVLFAAAKLAGQCPGAPMFTSPVASSPAGGGQVSGIAHADLDGDGDQDLVCCNGAQIVVIRNTGSNTFATEPPVPSPSNVWDLTVGDFDGDGLPDVAGIGTLVTTTGAATLLQGRAVIFLNRTQNLTQVTFAQPVVYPFGPMLPGGSVGRAIRSGDLDHDGILDLVLVDSNSTNVWVMRGQGSFGIGDGTFGAPVPYPVAATGHLDAAIGDFNQDGAPDLALVQAGGGVGPGFVTLLAGQLNGAGQANGTFLPAGIVVTPGPSSGRAIEAVDVNADGYLDLIVANYNHVDVAYGAGAFNFSVTAYPAGPYPSGLAIGDFTLDGIADIAVARDSNVNSGPGNFSMLVGQSGGGFTGYTTLSVNPGFPLCITACDFDGDARLDLALGRATGGVDTMISLCPMPPTALSVTMLSPNGGETIASGGTVVTWAKSSSVTLVDLDYSYDGGLTWEAVATSLSGTNMVWYATPPGSSQALMRVRDSGIGAISDTSNGFFTIVGPGGAASTAIGSGCAPAGPPPALTITLPVLGGLTTVAISGAGGVHPAGVFLSPVPLSQTVVSPGCTVYLDLGALLLAVEPTTDAFGIWGTTVSLPMSNALIGLVIRAQAAIVLPAPPGYALTNAVQLEFGF